MLSTPITLKLYLTVKCDTSEPDNAQFKAWNQYDEHERSDSRTPASQHPPLFEGSVQSLTDVRGKSWRSTSPRRST